MAQPKTVYTCSECGYVAPKWVGQCGDCNEWSTMVESVTGARQRKTVRATAGASTRLGDLPALPDTRVATSIEEFDRVFGGGLVAGSVTLLAGAPGIGKSTLAMQLAATVSRSGPVLYISGEESPAQVKARADRLGIHPNDLWLAALCDIDAIVAEAQSVEPVLVVVDSIQTVEDSRLDSTAGSVSQVRSCTDHLVRLAKGSDCAVVLVGHVTKEGSIAGPRVLEHLVDTVASLEGDSHHDLRLLRTSKNRFGSTHELGVFEMTSEGLIGVGDPSGRMLIDRQVDASGSAVAVVVEGSRPVMIEVQALVTSNMGPAGPRRASRGLESARLSQIMAVLQARAGFTFDTLDVYVSVIGGLTVRDPAADLAVAAAIVSCAVNRPIPASTVCWGELGLGGEIRQVSRNDQRITEVTRMGFFKAVVPSAGVLGDSQGGRPELAGVRTLNQALDAMGLSDAAVASAGSGR